MKMSATINSPKKGQGTRFGSTKFNAVKEDNETNQSSW
jgi:hypothetical protein